MIRLPDATTLALTKLRVRKVRTVITIVVSGLLFGILVAGLFIYQGVSNSLADFNTSGLGSRYLVLAHLNQSSVTPVWQNEAIQSRAKKIYQETQSQKTTEAKTLGLVLPSAPDPNDVPVTLAPGGGSEILNTSSPAAKQAIYEYQQTHPGTGLPELKAQAAPYHPIGFYEYNLPANQELGLHFMSGGVEDFSPQNGNGTPSLAPPDVFVTNSPIVMAPQLTNPFLYKNIANTTEYPNAIPLVVSYSVAAQIVGVDEVPDNAPANQKLTQIEKLYKLSKNMVFTACYRNSISEQQISNAIDYQAHKGNKSYEKPDVVYGLPQSDSCAPAKVINDARTPIQKAIDKKQMTFDKMFGATVQPAQLKIQFRIVGLSPNSHDGNSGTAAALFQNLAGSSLSRGMVIPQDMFQSLPNYKEYKKIFEIPDHPSLDEVQILGGELGYYVEFADANSAREFLQNESCESQIENACADIHKPFIISPFGSNSLGIESLLGKFRLFIKITLTAMVVVAIIILGGTIGRMLADGRRESAVFRSLGAKRIDITAIYMTYTFFLSVIVAAFALAVGFIAAYMFDYFYSGAVTIQAKLAFGAVNTSKVFDLFVYTPYVWVVIAVAVVAGLLSVILPLIRNVSRNPIKDLRDE